MSDQIKRIMSQDSIPEMRQKLSVFNVKWVLRHIHLTQEERRVLTEWKHQQNTNPKLERTQD